MIGYSTLWGPVYDRVADPIKGGSDLMPGPQLSQSDHTAIRPDLLALPLVLPVL